MERVISGIRPTGNLHLGNYFGAVKSFVKMQDEYDCMFFIADWHSLTTHPTPENIRNSVKTILSEYLACGIDPEKAPIYVQSDVKQVLELYLYLNMNAYLGELERVTSFKEKVRKQPDNVNAGLLTYPCLMAADILMHKADKVPVGKDQEQNMEMARLFARRFNRIYNVEYFKEPASFYFADKAVKVPGLDGTGKMGKSEGNCLYLCDDEKTVTKITFEGDNVVLHFADSSVQKADMESVVLTFGSTTAIQNLSAFTLRGLVDGQLQLSGLKKGTEVLIYNAAGKQVLRSTSAKINVSQLKSGVYLLKADHQIVKFVKR